jgi:RNA polymerase sigma-70 factor (ECF subfamily)
MSARRDRRRQLGEDVRADEFRQTLRRAKAGDENAVTTLYRLLQPRLIRYLGVLVPSDADRLASETWLDVIARLDGFDGDEHGLYARAFAGARRRASEAMLGSDGNGPAPEPGPVVDLDAASQIDDDGMAGFGLRSALAAIGRLPREQADIMLLRVLGELSIEQVAVLLDRPPETVTALQLQALTSLNWLVSTAGAA